MTDEMAARARGIDVNHFHSPHDWPAVFADGISFVGIKATQGVTFTDPKAEEHRAIAGATAAATMLYHYADASPDPVAQAEHFVDSLGGELASHELPVLDLERHDTGPMPFGLGMLPSVALLPKVKIWLDTVEGLLDVRPLLYCRRLWIQCGNLVPYWSKALDLWVPRYRALEDGPGTLPMPWAPDHWTFWQWSDGTTPPSSVAGVGPVDSNVFNGTELELAAFVAAAGRGPAGP
jgi:lysozyme